MPTGRALPRHLALRLRSAYDAAVEESGRPPAPDDLARRAGASRSASRHFLRGWSEG